MSKVQHQTQGIDCLPTQCPNCEEINEIDLSQYPTQRLGLFDICDYCEKAYGFDVEMTEVAISYKTSNSGLQ